jgi:hypothetical protein
MNALIEMAKLLAVTQGGMKPEIADMIGESFAEGADLVADALTSAIEVNRAATVRNLLDAAEIAQRIQKADPALDLTQVVEALVESAATTVLETEDDPGPATQGPGIA